ncbi:MAG: hypothetical protein IPI73_29745 [Betaproteobacteria bacterium]|nr:hypothetical protein [Betaproteobacteria bacterium]
MSCTADIRPATVPCSITALKAATADPSDAVKIGETVGNTTLCAITGRMSPAGVSQPCPIFRALSSVVLSVACDLTVVCANAAVAAQSVAAHAMIAAVVAVFEMDILDLS